jgi:hypothetical protein
MKDRVPVNPGRVLIKPENGAAYYATMTRADNATQEGTPLNKNSLLKDATAALFGLGADAVPDDVLSTIKMTLDSLTAAVNGKADIATGGYTGTGTSGPTAQVKINCGFTPKILVLYVKTEKATNAQYAFCVLFKDYALKGFSGNSGSIKTGVSYLEVNYTDNGFELYGEPINNTTQYIMNYAGTEYGYYAFG